MKSSLVLVALVALPVLNACGGAEPKDYLGVWGISGTTMTGGMSEAATGETTISQGLLRTILLKWNPTCSLPLDVDLVKPETAHLNVDLGRCLPQAVSGAPSVTVAYNFNSAEAELNPGMDSIHLSGSATRTTEVHDQSGTVIGQDAESVNFDWTLTRK